MTMQRLWKLPLRSLLIGATLVALTGVGWTQTPDLPFPPPPSASDAPTFFGGNDAREGNANSAVTSEPTFTSPITLQVGQQTEQKTVKIGGLVQLDSGYYWQDAANRTTLGDIQDGLGFRRVRFAASGDLSDNISYFSEFDIAQAQPRFVDVWMQINKTPFGNVRIGRYRQPFGMTELTSVKELPFLERPLVFAQSPFRQTGMMLFDHSADERTTWNVSGYRYLSDNFGNVYGDSGGYGLATRITHLFGSCPDDRIIHAGFGYTYNDPARDVVQFANTNEFFAGQNAVLGPGGLSVLPLTGVPPFVITGPINTQWVQAINLESAFAQGPFAVQTEIRWLTVAPTAGTNLQFPGAYFHVRYMLTGETIPYQRKTGVFGRIVPDCPINGCGGGIGAWELGARVSHVDFNDGPVAGRRLTNTTVGLTWYWNRFTKFQGNWIHSELNDRTVGDSRASTFAFRVQVDF